MLHFEAPQEPSAVAELSVFYIRFFIGSSSIEQIGDQSRNACEQWLESRGAPHESAIPAVHKASAAVWRSFGDRLRNP
jgi:hypothetical protein